MQVGRNGWQKLYKGLKMLQPKLNKQQISAMLQERRDRIVQAIQFRLQRTGEAFVTNARNTNTYKDHTGNLRGSIGYVILANGIQVDENFKSYPPKESDLKGTGLGPAQAKKIIDDIILKYPRGYVLICVAGMSYAAAVEAKGFDVITSSSLIAKNDLQKAMADIQRKISNS